MWLEEHGIGFYPVHDTAYDQAYFDNYRGYVDTRMGKQLTQARVNLVDAYVPGADRVLDVGIGCGTFVEAYGFADGYDVNPVGVAWLKKRGLWRNPYAKPVQHACFWDSLEHIEDPSVVLGQVEKTVFVSIPIFTGMAHARASKHFKPNEHYWYFTSAGFIQYMKTLGWQCMERNWVETDLGREDIETYVYMRA